MGPVRLSCPTRLRRELPRPPTPRYMRSSINTWVPASSAGTSTRSIPTASRPPSGRSRCSRERLPRHSLTEPAAGQPQFDARQLDRWDRRARVAARVGCAFSRAHVVGRVPHLCDRSLVLATLQALMIAALLVQRSQRRRAQAELREGDFRFQSMADMAPVLIWIMDADRNVTFFNKGWRDFVGDAWPGTPRDNWTSCVHPDDLPSVLAVYEQCVAARRDFSAECRLRKHDGEYRWMLCAGVPRFTLAGHFLGYIGSCSDINAIREGESEKQRLHAALAHVGRVATMGELTASLAHELYQPLAAILTNADTAQKLLESRSPPLDQVQEILTDIQTDDKHAAAIIRACVACCNATRSRKRPSSSTEPSRRSFS